MMRSPFFGDVLPLVESFDRAVNDAIRRGGNQTIWSRDGVSAAAPMPLDVYATDNQAVLLAAVPGLRPEELEITVHQNTVSLSGSVKSASDSDEAKGATWYIHELGSGVFRRSVTLPFPIDADRVEATFEHGIVRIVAPKAEHAKPRKIEVNAQKTEAIASGEIDQG